MNGATGTVVYDSGALIAAERDTPRFRGAHRRFLGRERQILVPTPVLTQVWRGGPRQARLAWTLRGCEITPAGEADARAAGVLLGKSRTADAVDAIVVATALRRNAVIVTSDPDDIDLLWRSAETGTPPLIFVV